MFVISESNYLTSDSSVVQILRPNDFPVSCIEPPRVLSAPFIKVVSRAVDPLPICCLTRAQLKTALESLLAATGVDVSRFKFLNGGSLWTVTFPANGGDVDALFLNASGLSGTGLLASVSEDVVGSALGGSFRLYYNGHSGALVGDEGETNSTGRSEPLAWNAEADEVRWAIETLLPDYASQGDVLMATIRSPNRGNRVFTAN